MTNRICSIDGCAKPAVARGWCQTCYRRWWRTGDPHPQPRPDNSAPIRPPHRAPVLGSHDAAWLAGLFEGEGTIHVRPNGLVRLAILMNDRDILERVDMLVPSRSGVRPVRRKDAPAHWKQSYTWYIGRKEDVEACLRAMLPWLGDRRKARALDALYALATKHPGTWGHQWRNKTHCKQGHVFDAENTRIYRGKRICKTCRRILDERRNPRRRGSARLSA